MLTKFIQEHIGTLSAGQWALGALAFVLLFNIALTAVLTTHYWHTEVKPRRQQLPTSPQE